MSRRFGTPFFLPWIGIGISLTGAAACVLAEIPMSGPLFAGKSGYTDVLLRSRPAVALDEAKDPVVIVGVDRETYSRLELQSIPRDVYAGAIDRILRAKPKAVVVDLLFEGRSPASIGMENLQAGIARSGEAAEFLPVVERAREKLDPDRVLASRLAGDGEARVIAGFISFPRAPPGGGNVREAVSRIHPESELDAMGCEDLPGHEFLLTNSELLAASAPFQGNGFVNQNRFGVIRRYPLFTRIGERIYPSLALLAAATYLDADVLIECDRDQVTGFSIGFSEFPHAADGTVPIDFAGSFAESFPNVIPLWKILPGSDGEDVPDRSFEGKLVFLGSAHPQEDVFNTPRDPFFSGVGLHATVAHSLVTNRWIRRDPFTARVLEPLSALLVGLLATAMIVRIRNPFVPLGAAALFPLAGHAASRLGTEHGMLVDALSPALVGSTVIFFCGVARLAIERKERLSTERELGRFLSPTVATIALRDPKLLHPSRREISILFSDVRGFTSLSETMEPEALVRLLDDYLTRMTEVVFRHRGTLDKYIGDAVMALFGAPVAEPRHSHLACRTALEMARELQDMQEHWREQGVPVLEIGIGINTGTVSVGRMGSRAKSEYTCIGDEVNFASRAEGLTKAYGVGIIVGQNTWAAAKDEFVFRDLGRVRVKGKRRAVGIYELLESRERMPETPEWLATFSRGLDAFFAQDWDRARASFELADSQRGGDPPSRFHLDRIAEFRLLHPGADWDGSVERRDK